MRTYTIGKVDPKPDIPFELNGDHLAARGTLPYLLKSNVVQLVAAEEWVAALGVLVRDDDEVEAVKAKGGKPAVDAKDSSWRRLLAVLADEKLGTDDAFVAGLAKDLVEEVTGRPTKRPSDSSSGQSAAPDGSEAGS